MTASLRFHLCLLLLVATLAGSAQLFPSFVGARMPASNYAYTQDVQLSASADINNDGNLDLLGGRANYVQIIYTDGAGTFIDDTLYVISLNSVTECDTTDLNHDGYEDIVGISNGSWMPEEEIFILMSDSLGRFTLTFNGATGGSDANQLTLNDFNNDGYTDAAVATGTEHVSVLYGNSAYGFQPCVLIDANLGAGSGYYITSADYNNDSLADIAATFDNNDYAVLLADSVPGVFQIANHQAVYPLAGIASPDLNTDGYPELVIGAYGPNLMNGAFVIPGTGTGLFPLSISTFHTTGFDSPVGTIFTPDINNDGFADLVLPWDYIAHNVFLGDGNLGLNYVQRAEGGRNPLFGDFNNDGYTDLYANTSTPGSDGYAYAFGDGSGLLPLAPRFHNDQNQFVKSADFNNDGYGDVISWNSINGNMGVDTGTAANGLQPAWTSNSPLGSTLTINDFNGDNILDLATYLCNSSSEVKVFIGDGNGGFAAPLSFVATGTATSAPSSWISSSDMNEDGNCDIIYGYGENFTNTCEYGILLSNGTGGFGAPLTASVNANYGFLVLEVGLINGDNHFDIVIHHEDARFSVLYGNGNATFAPAQLYTTGEVGCVQITIEHMDFDPYGDIVFSTGDDIDVHYGNAAGTFTTAVTYSGCDGVIACADLNGDWLTDFVSFDESAGAVAVRVGDGNGNFPYSDTFYLCEPIPVVCVIDVDGDGRKDVIDGRFSLFRNITPGAIITDVPSEQNSAETTTAVYPNPASTQTTLKLQGQAGASATIDIYTLSGNLVVSSTVPLNNGENNIPIDLQGLTAGVYVISSTTGAEQRCERLVVE